MAPKSFLSGLQIPMTIIENSIKKFYLEDFYYFCEEIGGETAELMGDLLKTRADVLTINITLNSLHTDFSKVRCQWC
jgi:V-type H+-transporting ATPase subunit d